MRTLVLLLLIAAPLRAQQPAAEQWRGHIGLGAAVTVGVGTALTLLDSDHDNHALIGGLVGVTAWLTKEIADAQAHAEYQGIDWTADNTNDLAALLIGTTVGYLLARWVNGWIWGTG